MERSVNLYQLPPGVVLCTNASGVQRLMNRTRSTVDRYVSIGQLRRFKIGGNAVIPLQDIARAMNLTETQLYNIAVTHRLPLWQVYAKGE